jgi:predicted esterase
MPARLLAAAAFLLFRQDPDLEKLKSCSRTYLWPPAAADRPAALQALRDLKYDERALSRPEFLALEKVIREGRDFPAVDPAPEEHVLSAASRPDRALRVLVTLPENYQPRRAWPLLVAMGGGPVPSATLAREQARTVAALWKRHTRKGGWILAVLEDTVSVREDRPELRYETLRPEDFRAALDTVQERFHVHPLKVVAAGLSLGANYAIQFAASRPDWFAGIVPVSSEGESREHVIRNLSSLSVYLLAGAKDRAVRTIEGPRRLAEILRNFEARLGYEEDPARGHDAFQDRYADVLRWLDQASRTPWPRVVVRVPHEGLFPVARRVYWIEADSEQAAVRAEARHQEIVVLAARARRVKVWFHDLLVDLDRDVAVTVNGKKVFEGKVSRTLKSALETAAADRAFAAAASLEFDVPLDRASLEHAYRWTQTLVPVVRESKLPWWEHYARETLKERRHRPGLDGEKLGVEATDALKFPEGLTGVRVTRVEEGSAEARAGLREGDILTGFEDEVFFRDGLGVSLLAEWHFRRPEPPASYAVSLLRDGKPRRLVVPLR